MTSQIASYRSWIVGSARSHVAHGSSANRGFQNFTPANV